jgi:ABC-type antimicrobial peptide transport system permease subunit
MKNTINFIKYHAVEFSKFTGFFIGTLLLFAIGVMAGGWTHNYLFPIIGNWTYLVTSFAGVVAIYMALQLYFPNRRREVET